MGQLQRHLHLSDFSDRSYVPILVYFKVEIEAGIMPKRRQGTLQEDSVSDEKRVRFADQTEECKEEAEDKPSTS